MTSEEVVKEAVRRHIDDLQKQEEPVYVKTKDVADAVDEPVRQVGRALNAIDGVERWSNRVTWVIQ